MHILTKEGMNMENFITGQVAQEMTMDQMKAMIGKTIQFNAIVHKIRQMSGFAFVIVRTPRDLIQCIYSEEKSKFLLSDIVEGSCVVFEGEVVEDARSTIGFEIQLLHAQVKAIPAEPMPIVIHKKEIDVSLDVNLTYRPITLRNPKERAVFKISEGIARGFREYLTSQNFTEIRTPKIVFAGAEGGANIFKLDYFGKQVFLAQSPQFYKQTMVGVFERVFEIAPVYRAEKHDTSRHLNEYISLDFEMGFIRHFHDVMNMETATLKYIFALLREEYAKEIELLKVTLPNLDSIPSMKFVEAKQTIEKECKKKITDYYDFEPEEEVLLCDYVKKKYGTGFVFVTHYPSEKRPFYTMDDPLDPGYTLGFDLLYNGLEITTGGQRVHDYQEQVDKMKKLNMNDEEFESYLMVHKHGIPPHGGLAIGLERFTMKLLGLSNVRQASLFPRDMNRVTP
jgi:nondiscriminating aspartyl-tRNA synthetase